MNLANEPASSGLATRRVAKRGPARGMAVQRKNRRVTMKNRLPAAPSTPLSTVVSAAVSLAGSSWSTAVLAGAEPMPWLVRKSVPLLRRLRASSAYCGSSSTSLAMASALPTTSTRTIAQAATRARRVRDTLLQAQRRSPPSLVRFALAVVNQMNRLEPFDRAMTLAAQAFTSIFPVVIVTFSLLPQDDSGRLGGRVAQALALPESTRS